MTAESIRLDQAREQKAPWKKWGPYLSERQWGTVREDYSEGGDAWNFFTHDQSRSRAYRWGEDGLAGISDDKQRLCFALAVWNGKDPILKERLFGLTNSEGNHGEDVKEYYFYLDSTPTHSYMKYLYKYPQAAYPYADLVETNRRRSRKAAAEKASPDVPEQTKLVTDWVNAWTALPKIKIEQVATWRGADATGLIALWTPDKGAERIRKGKLVVDFLLKDKAGASSRGPDVLDGGQKKFFTELYAKMEKDGAGDPQRRNAPVARCGKAGGDIKTVLDQPTADRDGFHTPRVGQTPDTGKLEQAKKAPDSAPHGSQCKTNAKGYAGVLFTPSRCGGDRYKLKVSIDPDWLKTKAPGVLHASMVTTGTMVVWRNLRLNRYIQMQTPMTKYSDPLTDALVAGGKLTRSGPGAEPQATPDWNYMSWDASVFTAGLIPGEGGDQAQLAARPISQVLAGGVEPVRGKLLQHRPLAVTPASMETHLNRGFCEFIADCDAVEPMDATEQKAAAAVGLAAFKKINKWEKGDKNIDWSVLYFEDATSPFCFNLLSQADYNAKTKAAWVKTNPPKGTANPNKPLDDEVGDQFTYGLQAWAEGAAEHFAGGGVLPGFTVIQVPGGFTWDNGMESPIAATVTSGYGTAGRAFWMAQTKPIYNRFIYPAISNFLHEFGHVLALAHPFDIANSHQPDPPEPLERPKADDVVCVMSYTGCYGDFCGWCLLALRGWSQTHSVDTAMSLTVTLKLSDERTVWPALPRCFIELKNEGEETLRSINAQQTLSRSVIEITHRETGYTRQFPTPLAPGSDPPPVSMDPGAVRTEEVALARLGQLPAVGTYDVRALATYYGGEAISKAATLEVLASHPAGLDHATTTGGPVGNGLCAWVDRGEGRAELKLAVFTTAYVPVFRASEVLAEVTADIHPVLSVPAQRASLRPHVAWIHESTLFWAASDDPGVSTGSLPIEPQFQIVPPLAENLFDGRTAPDADALLIRVSDRRWELAVARLASGESKASFEIVGDYTGHPPVWGRTAVHADARRDTFTLHPGFSGKGDPLVLLRRSSWALGVAPSPPVVSGAIEGTLLAADLRPGLGGIVHGAAITWTDPNLPRYSLTHWQLRGADGAVTSDARIQIALPPSMRIAFAVLRIDEAGAAQALLRLADIQTGTTRFWLWSIAGGLRALDPEIAETEPPLALFFLHGARPAILYTDPKTGLRLHSVDPPFERPPLG